MTFSIAARCERTGAFGVAVSSSSPAVAARCAFVRGGVGAACSQNITNPQLGPAMLDRLAAGDNAQGALDAVVAGEEFSAYRQLTVVDASGRAATFSGDKTLGIHGSATGPNVAAAGNLLSSAQIPQSMVDDFAHTGALPLEERLLSVLRVALDAGGEAGPVHSVGLLVIGDAPWPVTDLRVDFHDDPIGELGRLWELWAPQAADYITRGLDPRLAPAYGVPGDE
ncbi:DUF1028 domain-containing protein [Flexivirga oryzae]|uniref:Putative Ntn-hydrolase superfamily protein n=1 Tax=Flexivirga oryzae TaxID=1794944 RepID=A0A839NGA3_9MICO|nr:putative Ntn-hydrolase superfamily protein [Flexivirga oryzae]